MHLKTAGLLTASVLVAEAAAENYLGFNSGAFFTDYQAKTKKDFLDEFKTAQNLKGAPGDFNAVRLYTNIQHGSDGEPIEAFEAAIDTNTKILLGVWASGTTSIDGEIKALKKAIEKHGKKFTDLVIGASIGSEDLYRISETGIKNKSGVGNGPKEIAAFIADFKKAMANTPLADVPIGHVDTWDVWTNGTNKPVIDAVDWIGVDEYPYYQNATGNHISRAGVLFDEAFAAVEASVGGKPLWVTETGWPYTGDTWDEAEATVENAKIFWDEVGCRVLFNKVPTFWYNLRDSNPDNSMKFAITENLSTTPRFDLTCPDTFNTPDSSETATTTGSGSKPTGGSSGGTGSGSGSSTGVSAPGSSSTGSPTNGGEGGEETPAGTEESPVPTSAASFGKTISAGLALIAAGIAML